MDKLCSRCNLSKEHSEFYPRTHRGVLGLSAWCKSCFKVYNKENQERRNKILKDWRDKNREHVRKQDLDLKRKRRSNPEYRERDRKVDRDWQKKYRLHNPNFRIAQNMRSRLRQGMLSQNVKKTNKTQELLGCSFSELKVHLESQFKDGMSWENYGEWHIDHIHPLSLFDLTDEAQLKRACHYTNLQPMWEPDNLKKGNIYVG